MTDHQILTFSNGYGASIIPDAHCSDLRELAVTVDGYLTYDTPITSDVLRLAPSEIIETLAAISALPQRLGPARRTLTVTLH